jgi:glutamate-1-semialdehyde 2,1-aminomutase
MFLIRLARAYTGRPKIIKFIGAYHGSYDGVQLSVRPVAVGSQWQGDPETEGLCPGIAVETLAVPYNDLSALRNCLDAHRGQVALVLMDLSMNACGLITPKPGFLEGVLELTHASGALFGCDEVMTGFRYGLGGAAGLYGVTPDLVAFGKVLGGGLPIGAVAGRADFMSLFESLEGKGARVGQSGTFAANPLTMAAANAFLEHVMTRPEGYERVAALTESIRDRLREIARKHRIPAAITGAASAFQIHTGIEENVDHETFSKRDLGFRELLFLHLALKGIFAPGALGTFFVSWSHTSEDADALVDAVDEFFSEAS